MCLFKNFVTCGVISFKTCLVVQDEVLIACEDEMEEEIRVRALCVSRKRKRAREIKSNQEALHMAEKLSEYARSKGMRSLITGSFKVNRSAAGNGNSKPEASHNS